MQARSSSTPSSESFRPALGWNGQLDSLLAANERAFRAWARGVSTIAEEMNRFTQSRLREDAEAWQVLATARSPMDALECQRRFAEKAAAQYMEEAGRLSQLAVSIANESYSSAETELAEATLSPL